MILKMIPGGDTIDYDSLTAAQNDVLEGQTFIGAGNDETQTGTMPNRINRAGSPGFVDRPNVPIHQSVDVRTTTDTNGDKQIALAPPVGKYPGDNTAYVGVYPAELGIEPAAIANGVEAAGVVGTYGKDSTAAAGDVRNGKVYYDENGRQIGEAGDFAAASVTLKCGETHSIQKGFHQAGKVTAASLSSQTQPKTGDAVAEAAHILNGYGAWSNGAYRDGSMKNITADATITHTKDNKTKVVLGDACFTAKNSDNADRFEIRYNSTAGYITANTLFAIALDKVRSALGIAANLIKNGSSIAGIKGTYGSDATAGADHILKGKTSYGKDGKVTGTMNLVPANIRKGVSYGGVTGNWYGNKKAIGASGYCGSFGNAAYETQQFTMPDSGIVYYGGFACAVNGNGRCLCRILKNGNVIDNRDIDYNWTARTTMFNKSFSAAKNDVIKVEINCSAGSCVAGIQAVIVY